MIALEERLQAASPFQWGLVSLLDMIRFNGKRLVRLTALLSKLSVPALVWQGTVPQKADEPLKGDDNAVVLRVLEDYADALELPGFTLSKLQLERLRKTLESGRATHSSVARDVDALHFRIEDELSLSMVWQVPPALAAMFEPKLFGEQVSQSFPSLSLDVEESGKCLGMGRTTACVFHLMRVMEGGLRALAVTLNAYSGHHDR